MAEAKKGNSNLWKDTYRNVMSQIREWLSTSLARYALWASVVFMVYIIVLLGVMIWKYGLLLEGKKLGLDVVLKSCVETNNWLNAFLVIGLLLATILLTIYVSLYRTRWYHLALYPILPIVMLIVPKWYAVQSPIQDISYPILITVFLGLVCVVEATILVLNYLTKKEQNALQDGSAGFVAITREEKRVETGWDSYINTIFTLIGKHQLEKESFAIGVTGKWGSGKTTFYNAFKQRIQANQIFLLCEFKPWQIIEPSRMAYEFFTEFADVLTDSEPKKNELLRKSIIQYANLLTAVPKVKDYAKSLKELVSDSANESISTLRAKIESALVNKYVVVMIDDLDRLNKAELQEIMRLVRASANFKHVLFILTYDKGYFANVLGYKKGVEYLKKIVNVEISLPPIEKYKYGALLKQSILTIFNDKIAADDKERVQIRRMIAELERIIGVENWRGEQSLLYKNLSNFRDIKRFANQFGLALYHIHMLKLLERYYFPDLFWLELLHYLYEDIYNKLQTDFTSYLAINKSEGVEQAVLLCKVSSRPNENPFMPLLRYIFSESQDEHPINSVVWINNYYSYFAYRQLDNYVSALEFKLLLQNEDRLQVWSKVHGWMKNKYTRYSLMQVITDFPQNYSFETRAEANNYTYILLELFKTAKTETLRELIVRQFMHKYQKVHFQSIEDYTPEPVIRECIANSPMAMWNRILTAMVVTLDDDLMEMDPNSRALLKLEYVIDRKRLEELAQLNYRLFFNKRDLPLSEIFKDKSKFMDFILEASFEERVLGYDKNAKQVDSNLLGNYIVERFSSTLKKKRGDSEFNEMYQNLLKYAGVDQNHSEDMNFVHLRLAIERIFGSVKNFERFLNEHFILGDANEKKCEELGLIIMPEDLFIKNPRVKGGVYKRKKMTKQ